MYANKETNWKVFNATTWAVAVFPSCPAPSLPQGVKGVGGRTASPRGLGISPGRTWQRRPAAARAAGLWSGVSGSGFPRCSPTCTSSPWRMRTGGPVATTSTPCSISSSGTIRSAEASRCSPGCTTVCCSCAAFASQTKVRRSTNYMLLSLTTNWT